MKYLDQFIKSTEAGISRRPRVHGAGPLVFLALPFLVRELDPVGRAFKVGYAQQISRSLRSNALTSYFRSFHALVVVVLLFTSIVAVEAMWFRAAHPDGHGSGLLFRLLRLFRFGAGLREIALPGVPEVRSGVPAQGSLPDPDRLRLYFVTAQPVGETAVVKWPPPNVRPWSPVALEAIEDRLGRQRLMIPEDCLEVREKTDAEAWPLSLDCATSETAATRARSGQSPPAISATASSGSQRRHHGPGRCPAGGPGIVQLASAHSAQAASRSRRASPSSACTRRRYG